MGTVIPFPGVDTPPMSTPTDDLDAYEQGVADCLAAMDRLDGSSLGKAYDIGRRVQRRLDRPGCDDDAV